MKKALLIIVVFVVVLIAGLFFINNKPSATATSHSDVKHIYTTWDTMEYDKCVSAWLIVKFLDKNAKFVFYPQGTEITEGVVFDVPGAKWSRKHRKCTSQCILETIKNPDPAMERIVDMAGKIELNRWQLDSWPQAQKSFYEVRKITDSTEGLGQCFEKTRPYFDRLYEKLQQGVLVNSNN
ncbi:MAG: chromate resistance protein ChrB domain-containing protein [Planctomycetota bacterium]|jgi:hypothetical protein